MWLVQADQFRPILFIPRAATSAPILPSYYDGPQGRRGPDSPEGPQGSQGPQGIQGIQGREGPRGRSGRRGKTTTDLGGSWEGRDKEDTSLPKPICVRLNVTDPAIVKLGSPQVGDTWNPCACAGPDTLLAFWEWCYYFDSSWWIWFFAMYPDGSLGQCVWCANPHTWNHHLHPQWDVFSPSWAACSQWLWAPCGLFHHHRSFCWWRGSHHRGNWIVENVAWLTNLWNGIWTSSPEKTQQDPVR